MGPHNGTVTPCDSDLVGIPCREWGPFRRMTRPRRGPCPLRLQHCDKEHCRSALSGSWGSACAITSLLPLARRRGSPLSDRCRSSCAYSGTLAVATPLMRRSAGALAASALWLRCVTVTSSSKHRSSKAEVQVLIFLKAFFKIRAQPLTAHDASLCRKY